MTRRSSLLFLAPLLLLALSFTFLAPSSIASPSTIRVWISDIGPNEVRTVSFEDDYVKRVTEVELGSGHARQALFAVAIAVRSIAWNRVIHPLFADRQYPADVNDYNPQRYIYNLSWGSDVDSVVNNSKGNFVAYKDDSAKGNPAFTTNFAYTGNPTKAGTDTNPGNVPNLTQPPYSDYLKSTSNPPDYGYPPRSNTGLSQTGAEAWANHDVNSGGGAIWPQLMNQFFTDVDLQVDGTNVSGGSFIGYYYNIDSNNNCSYVNYKYDAYINSDWGNGSAWPGVVGSDRFCIAWYGTAYFPYTGWYTFYTTNDDGVWLQVDNKQVIDSWVFQNDKRSGMIYLTAGNHNIAFWYFENYGGAKVKLAWLPTEGLIGEYHSGSTNPWSSPITRVRSDGALRYDWWDGQPESRVSPDVFSVRWRGTMYVPALANYTLEVRVDDGVQLFVDGELIIDQWRDQGATTFQANRTLGIGLHSIDIWYYENAGYAVSRFRVYPP